MIGSPTYPDYDGFEIFQTEAATAMAQPRPAFTLLQQAAINAQNAYFRNFDAVLSCVQRRNQQPPANGPWPYVDGWDTTLSIIRCVAQTTYLWLYLEAQSATERQCLRSLLYI